MKSTLVALLAAGVLAGAAAPLAAQGTSQGARRPSTPASAIARAQEMIGDGDATGGRAVLDSLLGALPDGAPEIAAVLFARAAGQDSPADAERDYRRVAVEFPSAPVAADATLRLAQLELQRGDRARAVSRLERLAAEQPDGPVRARASYWTAQAYFEDGNAPRGCAALAVARTAMDASDVEMRNQVDYYAPRCRDVAAAPAADTMPNAAAGVATNATPPATAADTAAAPATVAATADSSAAADTHAALDTRPSIKPVPKLAAKGATKATTKAAPKPAATPATPARVVYTVQVAALQQRPPAATLVRKLRAGGWDARIDGTAAPFRVRIGRYATRPAAEAVAARLRAKRTSALVVEASRR